MLDARRVVVFKCSGVLKEKVNGRLKLTQERLSPNLRVISKGKIIFF